MSNKTIFGCAIAAFILLGAIFVYSLGIPPASPPGPRDAAMENNKDIAGHARQNAVPLQRGADGRR